MGRAWMVCWSALLPGAGARSCCPSSGANDARCIIIIIIINIINIIIIIII